VVIANVWRRTLIQWIRWIRKFNFVESDRSLSRPRRRWRLDSDELVRSSWRSGGYDDWTGAIHRSTCSARYNLPPQQAGTWNICYSAGPGPARIWYHWTFIILQRLIIRSDQPRIICQPRKQNGSSGTTTYPGLHCVSIILWLTFYGPPGIRIAACIACRVHCLWRVPSSSDFGAVCQCSELFIYLRTTYLHIYLLE